LQRGAPLVRAGIARGESTQNGRHKLSSSSVERGSRGATRRWPKVALAALAVVALVVFFAFDGPSYLSLDAIKLQRDALLSFTEAHYAQALVIAFCAYVAATSFGIPSGTLFALLLGFLFGRWVATGLIVIGGTIGASLLFVTVRYLFADAIRRRFGSRAKRIEDGFTRNAFSWMLFLRLTPMVPYFLVNLIPTVTGIRLRTYALATLIGIIPVTFVFTNLGQTLGRIESTRDLLSPETLTALALLGVLALIPVVLRYSAYVRRG
jgi:uncharacterized membrane protein YdjX (TVP38/TMEM64 family)